MTDCFSYFDLSKSRTSRPVQVALLMRNMEVLSLEDSNLVISNEQVFRNMGSLKVRDAEAIIDVTKY